MYQRETITIKNKLPIIFISRHFSSANKWNLIVGCKNNNFLGNLEFFHKNK